MKKTILSILAVAFAMGAFAQKNVTLTIKHMLGTSPFTFNQAATNNIADNFSITRVDYYLSGFTIIHDGGMQTIVPANTILFVRGGANHVASLGTFNVTNIEGIKFSVGVNANVNATMEPATAAYPLDFTTNMWWGWASGYRFVALEGKSGTSLNQSYQYHGLFDPNYFEQTVMVNGVNSSNGSMRIINYCKKPNIDP